MAVDMFNELVDMAVQGFKQAQGLYMTACRMYDFMAGIHPEADYNKVYGWIHQALTEAYMEVYDIKYRRNMDHWESSIVKKIIEDHTKELNHEVYDGKK